METHVPVSFLIPSPANARRTNRLVDIDVLAAQIKSQGLLQNLVVRENGRGKYEVVDGLRRLAALKALVKSGDWPKGRPVAINVLSSGHSDTEVSLAANIGRVDMHPADTFEAFQRLADEEGASPDSIGMRFGYATATVRGFLKLANVSPRLMKAFRRDELTLDQMKALAITGDHKRQETAFFEAPDYLRSPRDLRGRIMEGRARADDKFARFVGVAAYETAGGAITRDLFGAEGDLYFEDSGLLQRLALARLEEETAVLREQGWKWTEIHPDLTESECRRRPSISMASHGFEPDSDVARLHGGVVIGVDGDGRLKLLEGVLKSEDAKALVRAKAAATDPCVSAPASNPMAGREMSASLVEDMTAFKTAVLQAAVAKRPDIALAMAVHDLALPLVYKPWESGANLTQIAPVITQTQPWMISAAIEGWRARLPMRPLDLWPWVLAQEQGVLLDLLAVAVSANVNAIRHPHEKKVPARVTAGERLARSLAIDMAEWWQPDASFLSRLSKAALLSAIAEALSPEVARSLDHCSKAELVAVAGRRLKGTGWLPVPLRTGYTEAEAADVALADCPGIDDGDGDLEPAADRHAAE